MQTTQKTILINNHPYHVDKESMTGLEIKQLAKADVTYFLFLVVKNPDKGTNGDDIKISDDQVVELKDGMRFRIVNPGNFG